MSEITTKPTPTSPDTVALVTRPRARGGMRDMLPHLSGKLIIGLILVVAIVLFAVVTVLATPLARRRARALARAREAEEATHPTTTAGTPGTLETAAATGEHHTANGEER